MKQPYPTKFLDCWPKLKELRRQYAKGMWSANRRGELLIMGGVGLWNGVLGGFGAYHFSGGLGPNFSRLIADPPLHRQCLQAAEARGYGTDMCATLKVTLGAMLAGQFDVSKAGDRMKSDFIWDVYLCQSQVKCTQLWADFNPDLPCFGVEMPPTIKEKDHLISQWQEAIEGIEKATGREYSDELLFETVKAEWDVRVKSAKICELQKTIPAPLNQRWLWSIGALFVRGAIGRKENVEFCSELLDEVEDRVKNGIAALPWERCRLAHEGIPTWYRSPVLEYPNRYGALFIGSCQMYAPRGCWVLDDDLTYHVGPTFEEVGLELKTRADGLEALARLYLEFGVAPRMILNYEAKVAHIVKCAQDWHHDAVVFNNSRECRGMSTVNQESALALRAKGIPVLCYEGGTADPQMLDVPRYVANMDAFMESLGLKAIDDYAPVEPPDYNEF